MRQSLAQPQCMRRGQCCSRTRDGAQGRKVVTVQQRSVSHPAEHGRHGSHDCGAFARREGEATCRKRKASIQHYGGALRETEEQLASGAVSDEQRMDIHAIRSSLVGERYAEIIQQRNNLLEREARIRKRLAEERQRLDSRLPVTR